MRKTLWKRQQQIETLVLQHLAEVAKAIGFFQGALVAYLEENDIDKAGKLAFETHHAEGVADDVRREVEVKLLAGALLPASRRDLLEVIEQVDRLANAAESILDYLLFQKPEIPTELAETLLEIVYKTGEIFERVETMIKHLFSDLSQLHADTQAIEKIEGEIDQRERAAIKRLFKMDLDLAKKIQLHGLVERLVEISDRAEDLSDHVDIIAVDRHF